MKENLEMMLQVKFYIVFHNKKMGIKWYKKSNINIIVSCCGLWIGVQKDK